MKYIAKRDNNGNAGHHKNRARNSSINYEIGYSGRLKAENYERVSPLSETNFTLLIKEGKHHR
jgi:hypothetical protein